MLLKFVLIAVVLSIGSKMIFGKWPWEFLSGRTTRQQAVLRARQLLGVDISASHSEIIAAHKRVLAKVHPDKGGSNDQVHEANAARDLLLSELPDQTPPD